MPFFKRKFNKRRRYRRRVRRYFKKKAPIKNVTKRGGKYYAKKRISRKAYNNRRQQLLSVRSVKKICRRLIKKTPETFKLVRDPLYFYNQNHGWKAIPELNHTPQGSLSNTYQTPNVYSYALCNINDIAQGTGVSQISGDKWLCKSVCFKMYIQWFIKMRALKPKLKWALVQTSKSGSLPIMNANMWKNNLYADPKWVFAKNRKAIAMKVLKRGTIYPPKYAYFHHPQQPVTATINTGVTTNGHAKYLSVASYEETTEGTVSVSPNTTPVFSTKVLNFKLNKYAKIYNNTQNQTQDAANTAFRSQVPYRLYLVMWKEIWPITTGNPITDQNNLSVMTQKTMYYSDV